ncbi:hypothetical protein LOZ80_00195 [Paenibacillus sp. HWE-109]|uniref:hypothetical protein n=1 Tax=Paenibacillus sp. HWE-109 TaxID=1306526 RepID=UPI001EE0A193|nr:hypothetical protein [Paenibacillus sp. HWE-109]UKS27410.1 hypothetical protein LOZ80_00195 [Paenibacillus sp. HWE-109]
MTSKGIPLFMAGCLVITLYQWFRLKGTPRNEKITYIAILALCWILAISLVVNPTLPGPSQMVDSLFRPIGKLIDK